MSEYLVHFKCSLECTVQLHCLGGPSHAFLLPLLMFPSRNAALLTFPILNCLLPLASLGGWRQFCSCEWGWMSDHVFFLEPNIPHWHYFLLDYYFLVRRKSWRCLLNFCLQIYNRSSRAHDRPDQQRSWPERHQFLITITTALPCYFSRIAVCVVIISPAASFKPSLTRFIMVSIPAMGEVCISESDYRSRIWDHEGAESKGYRSRSWSWWDLVVVWL